MNAVNCPRCGRVFTKVRANVCPSCVKEDDETFEEVRAYVKEHPDHSISVVSEETDVPVKRIIQYIRDGRLEVSSGISSDVGCSKCGRPIAKGRFCEKCASEIQSHVLDRPEPQQQPKKSPAKAGSKMHIERR